MLSKDGSLSGRALEVAQLSGNPFHSGFAQTVRVQKLSFEVTAPGSSLEIESGSKLDCFRLIKFQKVRGH